MTDDELTRLIEARKQLWNSHPIITQSAVLPTNSVRYAVGRVLDIARRNRASLAYWADPLSGKTWCLQMIEAAVREKFPGCGVLVIEAVEDEQAAEGRLLEMILGAGHFAMPVNKSLEGKRQQVHRMLLGMSGTARHIFILIDEAQGLSYKELKYLKAVINGLSRARLKVTTVICGQRELRKRREEIFEEARSDLGVRFMDEFFEFRRFRTLQDMHVYLTAIDSKSKFPLDSGWTYTQFLFPRAHAAGFRFAQIEGAVWNAIKAELSASERRRGPSMELVAGSVASVAIRGRELDAPGMVLPDKLIEESVHAAIRQRS